MDGMLGTLSVALGKAEVIFQKMSFSPLAYFEFFAMSCPSCLVDIVFWCGRAVDVSWLVLLVEKCGSHSSLNFCAFSKMLQMLTFAFLVVLFDDFSAVLLFGQILYGSLPPLSFFPVSVQIGLNGCMTDFI